MAGKRAQRRRGRNMYRLIVIKQKARIARRHAKKMDQLHKAALAITSIDRRQIPRRVLAEYLRAKGMISTRKERKMKRNDQNRPSPVKTTSFRGTDGYTWEERERLKRGAQQRLTRQARRNQRHHSYGLH